MVFRLLCRCIAAMSKPLLSVDELRQCRICLDTDDAESLIAPCRCAGTQRWVHRPCLDEWRAQERVPRAFTQCPTCHFVYETEEHDDRRSSRVFKFRLFVCRDTAILFFAAQCVLALVAFILHACDSDGAIKRLYPHQWAERKAALHLSIGPYYVTAVVICLALLGLLGLSLRATGRMPPPPPHAAAVSRHDPCSCNGCMCPADSCMYCDCCGAGPSSCECGTIGGSDCAACCEGSGEGGAVLLPILAVLAIILALVGLFFAVFFSTFVIQRVLQRHVHLLQMRSETQRVVVIDLAHPPGRCMAAHLTPRMHGAEGLAERV